MSWDLNPLNWGRTNVPVHRHGYQQPVSPADRFFDDFFNLDFPSPSSRDFVPSLDVAEDDKEVRIEVELPGMEEQDIDVNLSGNVLTIQGEKRSEQEFRDRGVHRRERKYGSFVRSVELPQGLDFDQICANFKNGLLCIKVPKSEEFKQHVRNVPIGERRQTDLLQGRTESSAMSDRERKTENERMQARERERMQGEQARSERRESPLQ